MKSITEGPFQMGTFIQTPAEDAKETEGALQLGPERARVFTDLSAEENESTSTDNLIESLTNTLALLNQSFKAHLPQTNNQLRTSSNARNNATVQDDRVVVQDVRGMLEVRTELGNVILVTTFDENMDDLALDVDHVFEADQCDAFDSDVDEAPTTQTMFMANLSSEDPIYNEAGTSYDSNTQFEVQDHDTFVDHMDEYHEVHEMQRDVQHNYVVDSDADKYE
ncbi:hypothetical protein Tco_0185804 [Tanacetum coccineum]